MEATVPPADSSGIHWIATWGDKVKEGDLLKTKGRGPVRIDTLRKFDHNHPRPVVTDEEDNGHWVYGAVVTDIELGTEFHVFIQPHEPCFIGLNTPPATAPITGDTEGAATDGDIDEL